MKTMILTLALCAVANMGFACMTGSTSTPTGTIITFDSSGSVE